MKSQIKSKNLLKLKEKIMKFNEDKKKCQNKFCKDLILDNEREEIIKKCQNEKNKKFGKTKKGDNKKNKKNKKINDKIKDKSFDYYIKCINDNHKNNIDKMKKEKECIQKNCKKQSDKLNSILFPH
jgi:hypothetical protein